MATAQDGSQVEAVCYIHVVRAVTGITLNHTSATLGRGESLQLLATLLPPDAANQLVAWSSGDTNVVRVDANGRVLAVGNGSAVVTAKADGGNEVTASCTVTVIDSDVGLIIQPGFVELLSGETALLACETVPAGDVVPPLVWASSDQAVVSVDGLGGIMANAPGEATITATAQDGSGRQGLCLVKVKQLVASISFNHAVLTMAVGNSQVFAAAFEPGNASDTSLAWSSTDPQVVAVDKSGKALALKPGKAIITATANDGGGASASCEITVVQKVHSIVLKPTSIEMETGESRHIAASLYPADASFPSVTWASSDDAVASVDETGLVRGVSQGIATITATAADGGGTTASCRVIVSDVKAYISLNSIRIGSGNSWSGFALYPKITVGALKGVEPVSLTLTIVNSTKGVTKLNQTGVSPGTYEVTGNFDTGTYLFSVTAKDMTGKEHTATITTRIVNGGGSLYLEAGLLYSDYYPVSIQVTPAAYELPMGQVVQLSKSITPAKPNPPEIKWVSSDESVATVSADGLVTAVGVGQTVIRATAFENIGVDNACTVTVVQRVSDITLNPVSLDMLTGTKQQLTASVLPDNATNKNLLWSSSDEGVAKVDENGEVSALDEGTATITASAQDGSGVSRSVVVTVTKRYFDLSNVKWSDAGPFVYDGSVKTMELTGLPEGLSVVSYTGNKTARAGIHTASAVLAYDNILYYTPDIKDLVWTIQPKVVSLSWSGWETRVYDGLPSDVTALALDLVEGDICEVIVANGTVVYGGNHLATAVGLSNTNYQLPAEGLQQPYTINKAVLNLSMTAWDYKAPFTYDGIMKRVLLTGLPDAVQHVVYTGNTATSAGTYIASASLLFDERSFLPASVPSLTWQIVNPAPWRASVKVTKIEALSGSSLRLTWNRITGAAGYQIERATNRNGPWTHITYTTGLTYTNSRLVAGTMYFYRMRTYDFIGGQRVISGKNSAVYAGIPVATTRITATQSISTSRLKLTWAKSAGATSYQIFLGLKPVGPFNAIRTTPNTYLTLTGLRAGTYYFIIKPYKRVYTTTYYGPQSPMREASTFLK